MSRDKHKVNEMEKQIEYMAKDIELARHSSGDLMQNNRELNAEIDELNRHC